MSMSLTMTKQRTIAVQLPTAASSPTHLKPDSIHLAVNAAGQTQQQRTGIQATGQHEHPF